MNPSDSASGMLEEVLIAVREIREEQIAIRNSISTWQDKFSDYTKSLEVLHSSLAQINASLSHLTSENTNLKKNLGDLEQQLNRVEQDRLRNTIEIRGIPVSNEENVEQLVCKVGLGLGLKVDNKDIDFCYRLKPRASPLSSSQSPKPTPIIVRFVRSGTANAFIQAKRNKPNLTLGDINTDAGPSHARLYINESLTPLNRKMYAAAKNLKSEGKIKYLWVRNGRVYTRVRDGGERILISKEEDLSNIY